MSHPIIPELESHRGYPAISVFLTTHRTHPENKQDPIQLKNLVKEVEERLLQEFTKREAAAAIKNLNSLADGIDHDHNLEGLALFASEDFARAVRVPFPLKNRAQIDETFAIRDLVMAYNRSPHYLLLVFAENNTRLFTGFRDFVEEIKLAKFPMEHGGPGGASKLPGGRGVNPSAVRDTHRRDFVRSVDHELAAVLHIDDAPIVVAGTEDLLADFHAETQHADRVVGTIKGSYGSATAHELGDLAWAAAREGFAEIRAQRIARLEPAVSSGNFASGIVQVWQAAHEGRVDLIIAEEDYRQPGILPSEEGHLPTIIDDATDPSAVDDLVDVAVQLTIEKGGKAVFADPGSLTQHDRVAAILRF